MADNPFLSRVSLYAHRQPTAPPNTLSPSLASSPVHTTFHANAPFRLGANGKELDGSTVNSPVTQGTRPPSSSSNVRAKDKKEPPAREGNGKKDATIGGKEDIVDGNMVASRPAASRGKLSTVDETLIIGEDTKDSNTIGYPDDRISDDTREAELLHNTPSSHAENEDNTTKVDVKGAASADPTQQCHGGALNNLIQEPLISTTQKNKATVTVEDPISDEIPIQPPKNSSFSSHVVHQLPQLPVVLTGTLSSKRKRGSVDQPYNDKQSDTLYGDHNRVHQPSGSNSRSLLSHPTIQYTQPAQKREPVQSSANPIGVPMHQTHRRRSSSTTTTVMRDHPETRPEPPPPPPPQPVPVSMNPLDDGDDEDDEEDEPVDPNEPRYCICNQVSYGQMVGCDDRECAKEWFHLDCVGLTHPPNKKGMNQSV